MYKYMCLCVRACSETGGEVARPEEWTDPWDRQARKDAPKPKKRKTKVSMYM